MTAASMALTLREVGKTYRIGGDTKRVLDAISLAVRPGEFIGIAGASGCGKSTLLRLIAGLDPDYDGEILADGHPVREPALERGIMFQDHRLLPWLTVEQNIAFGLLNADLSSEAKQRAIEEHIALVGLHDFTHAFAHQLSGGMAQRVALARALVNRPRLLLLDEPFGALDALTRTRMQDELNHIARDNGLTVILVTHDVDEALFLADRVIAMRPRPGRIGQIIEVSEPYPRDRGSAALARLRARLLDQLFENPLTNDEAKNHDSDRIRAR